MAVFLFVYYHQVVRVEELVWSSYLIELLNYSHEQDLTLLAPSNFDVPFSNRRYNLSLV